MTTEEVYNYKADVDGIKALTSKKYVKALTYFAKYMMPNAKLSKRKGKDEEAPQKNDNGEPTEPTIMDIIK